MKRITLIETFDGARHETEGKALRHLEEIKGARFTAIARRIAASDWKYTTALEIMESLQTLEAFRTILMAEDDKQLTED